MAQITGGKIFYSQVRQAAQFEPKKAEVELAFVVGEGEGFAEIAAIAEAFAINKVQEMIGAVKASTTRTVQAAPPKPAVAAKTGTAAIDTTPVPSKEAYAASQKADKAAAKTSVPKAGKAADKPAISTGEERVNPADDAGVDMGGGDDFLEAQSDTVVIEVATVITDVDIKSALTKVNQKINNPTALRALVATFVAPPKSSSDIPQDKRQEFLDKLNAMAK